MFVSGSRLNKVVIEITEFQLYPVLKLIRSIDPLDLVKNTIITYGDRLDSNLKVRLFHFLIQNMIFKVPIKFCIY